MFLVLDTNVLISAALGEGACRQAFELAYKIGQLVHSEETFLELAFTLEKPRLQKYLQTQDKIDFLTNFLLISKPVQVLERFNICRDPKDNMFLELAVASKAEAIISRDGDLLHLEAFRNIPILTVARFISQFEDYQKNEHPGNF